MQRPCDCSQEDKPAKVFSKEAIPEYNWWVCCTDMDIPPYCLVASVFTPCIVPARTTSAIDGSNCEVNCCVNFLMTMCVPLPFNCFLCCGYNAMMLGKAREHHGIKGTKYVDLCLYCSVVGCALALSRHLNP
jgi:hypothetical protein